MNKKNCKKCNKEFTKSKFCSKKEWIASKYCSRSCANSVNSTGKKYCLGRISPCKGRKFPERSGKNNPRNTSIEKICLQCGKNFIVRNYRKNTAKLCSRYCNKIYLNKGISSKNEIVRKSIEYRLWREAVFARDNWTCQKYKIKGLNIHPHHIQNFSQFPELRFAIDNGITFSEKAHKEFHKKYSVRNNTKLQLEEFLSILKEKI